MSALEPPVDPVPGEERSLAPQVTPYDWPEPWMGAFLESLARMPNVAAACRIVGTTRTTAYRHARENPVFREAWKEAIDIGVDLLERIAHQRASTGWESTETRRRVKRVAVLDANGNPTEELAVIEDETVTVTRAEVSDQLMVTLLKAYRPRRFREQVEHHLGPADDLEASPQPVGPEDDGIHRVPTHERTLELARLALELEPGVDAVIDGVATRKNGKK